FQTDLGFELRRVNCPFLSFRHFAVFPVQDYSLNHCLKSWIHYKTSWNGYKLHIDTADCGVPIAALLCSASMHDSRAAVPLSHITKQRVTNLYDVMDAAYCSKELHDHCRELGHVPLIDHNPRGGE
ncbi:transposase, partial [Massilia sp. CCM 8734]|uniref:transposase n=1 Tax=Massilia sp. CCM 8734 TaxID=2609283 RepID=UPI001E54CA5D